MTPTHPLDRGMHWQSLLRFTLPNIAIFLCLSSYTIADGMFVSHYVGTLALSAVNMVWPVMGILYGSSLMLAIGGSAIIARLQGEGKGPQSRGIFTTIIGLILVGSILLSSACLLNIDAIVHLCRATAAQHELSLQYLRILLYLAPALMLQAAFQVLFITAGRPQLGLVVSILAGCVNMVLDYLFIVRLGWGVDGAAWATGAAGLCASLIGLGFFSLNRRSDLHFTRPLWDVRALLHACSNGSSEMVTHISSSLVTFLFNTQFLYYLGESGVAAITIALYFQFCYTGIFFGYAEGVSPLISYQFGKRQAGKLHQGLRSSLRIIASISILSFLLALLGLRPLLKLFTGPEDAAYHITLEGFPLFALAFLMMGVSIFISAFFTALGNGKLSALIALCRNGILCLSILFIPKLVGAQGLWLSLPLAELITIGLALIILRIKRSSYNY